MATSHYENFHVVTFLLPRHLHQDFYNVYAFCRWADDLGDELDDPAESLRLLAWWRTQLRRMDGEARHPVFVALRETVRRRTLPPEPFEDLITAFERDQTTSRYPDLASVLDYCRYSANPVGRLVLGLCGYHDSERFRLSDATCTALQLANFWQDVAVDWRKDRVYMPLDVLARHGASVEDIRHGRATPGFRAALRELCGEARRLFLDGLPLARTVDRRLALDLSLFSQGGLRVLEKIERQEFDVLAKRPAIGKVERTMLALRVLARWAVRAA
ncbi:MAG: squalene synthase HpnC [Acidobacteria bacterium]|nr:squalene synthase HpnC [Acidobacteriota bacterium]